MLLAAAVVAVAVARTAHPVVAATSYSTVPAARTSISDVVAATGTVAAGSILNLDFGTAKGVLTELAVAPGQVVVAGQRLARVDDRAQVQQVAVAEAQVAAAEAAAAALAAADPTSTTPALAPRAADERRLPFRPAGHRPSRERAVARRRPPGLRHRGPGPPLGARRP
ncbi:MAG: hypothetical protein NVSMB13_04300 [Mycobacteriales bacterium]